LPTKCSAKKEASHKM